MLSAAQADHLTLAMYVVFDMLLGVQKMHSEIKESELYLKRFREFTPEYTKQQKQHERFERVTKDAIKDFPTIDKKYREAISILQQYPDRPGVKELLGKVYEEYPGLKPGPSNRVFVSNEIHAEG